MEFITLGPPVSFKDRLKINLRGTMRLLLFISFLFTLLPLVYSANNGDNILPAATDNGGYRIEVELQNFDGDTLLLGYYFGKAQYLKDTSALTKGKFVFEGEDDLKPGVYLLVLPPDNKFIHVLIAEGQTKFSMSVDVDNIVASAKFKGSAENIIYYDYLRELEKRRPMADTLRKRITEDSLHKEVYQKDIAKLDEEVKIIQDDIRAKYPSSITAMMINANRDISIPEF